MTTVHLSGKTTTEESARQVPHLNKVAAAIRDNALAQAQKKLVALQGDLKHWLHRRDFVEYFMHSLASEVAGTLAANDRNVQAIYVHEPSLNPDSESGERMPLDTTVHLLVQVTTPSAALEAFIAALDRALTASLKELPSLRFAPRKSILNVTLINAEDIRLGLGKARLLSAVFAPPLKIWQRA